MIVSNSVSLLAVGVASGICFIFLSSIRKRKSEERKDKSKRLTPVDDSRCGCCLKPFLIGRGVECSDCCIRSCRTGCSRWDTTDNAWHCLFCHQKRSWLRRNERWFEVFGGADIQEELHYYFSTAKSKVYVAGVEDASASSGLDLAEGGKEEGNSMETVRDFVEKIVEGIIGNVDDTPIDKLYHHPAYDRLLGKYSALLADALVHLAMSLQLSLTNKPNTDPPAMAHRALRELVGRAVDEARKLPSLGGSAETSTSSEGRSIAEQSYEDLLATAILNKVVEKYQREQVDGNSNVLPENTSSRSKCVFNGSETGLDEGVEEGSSSLEPFSQDECSSECSFPAHSRNIRNHAEPMSLTIEERIEEVTTYASDEENREGVENVLFVGNSRRVPFPEYGMDIVDPSQESSEESQDEQEESVQHVALVTPVESWEDNWLFQKKKIHARADPVAMLVPNPSADFKALIGDKDAEDTSDLSECSSAQSDEEIERELRDAIDNVVPRSPTDLEFPQEESLEMTTNRPDKLKDEILRERSNSSMKKCEKPEKPEVCCLVNSENRADKKSNQVPVAESLEEEMEKSVVLEEKVNETESNVKTDVSRVELPQNGVKVDLPMEKPKEIVPKTPSTTPTRTSVTENQEENFSVQETYVTDDETVLNSLESAKKKLLDSSVEEKSDSSFGNHSYKDFTGEDEAQQESEYTEHYDIATQRHMDSLTKTGQCEMMDDLANPSQPAQKSSTEDKSENNGSLINVDPTPEQRQDDDSQLTAPPRPGTIAEREHKKWENAAPIENNPYSEKNIQKRLWEKQYARRSSDLPGLHPDLPKDLDILEPVQPDIYRFGRDYYINNAKVSSGDRTRKSTGSISSRPGSSLSQRSDSIGADHERQETKGRIEPDIPGVKSNDVRQKVAKWQQNNAEVNKSPSPNPRPRGRSEYAVQQRQDPEIVEEKYLTKNDTFAKGQKPWQDRGMENFLENERKNSKNEINAKLNNNYESKSLIETRNEYSGGSRRTIRRIDLKAYGFEKDFGPNSNEAPKKPAQRVVNKLDLKSFGFDGGLRRTQSNNHLDSTLNRDFKPRVNRLTDKSNLTRYDQQRNSNGNDAENIQDESLTKSTETLNNLQDSYGSMMSAKSVPNITKSELYSIPRDRYATADGVNGNGNGSFESLENVEENVEDNNRLHRKIGSDSLNGSFGSEVEYCSLDEDRLDFMSVPTELSAEQRTQKQNGSHVVAEKKPSMPSVKTLARAFSNSAEPVPVPAPRSTKSNGAVKERSSTPEVQITETPKQMHSLTARSLSKEFREGLRQIPNKVVSPPASHVLMENTLTTDDRQVEQSQTYEDPLADVAVIAPGKLKSNILFWEEMQRRS